MGLYLVVLSALVTGFFVTVGALGPSLSEAGLTYSIAETVSETQTTAR